MSPNNKFKRVKLEYGNPVYGWVRTKLKVNSINISMSFSGVFPPFYDLIEALESVKASPKIITVLIEEEGPETEITFIPYEKYVRIKLTRHSGYYKKGFHGKLDFLVSKEKLIKEFKTKTRKLYNKNYRELMLNKHYPFWIRLHKLKGL